MGKKLINEIMGVPSAIAPWKDTITNIILKYIKHEIEEGWYSSGQMVYTNPINNEKEISHIHRSQAYYLDYYDFLEEVLDANNLPDVESLFDSKFFKELPIWKTTLSFVVTTMPDHIYTERTNQINASVNQGLTGKLIDFRGVKVLPKVNIKFNITMPSSGVNKIFLANLKSTISHEMLHIYQVYKQLESGGDSHFGQESMLNAMSNNPELRFDIPWWDQFLQLVYLHLSFEVNARVPQLYDYLKELGVDNEKDFMKEVKKSDIWVGLEMLSNFRADEFINSFELPKDFELPKVLKSLNTKTSTGDKTIESLINLWDIILTSGNETIKNDYGIDFKMLPVPQNAKEDPYVFFKFFEKRFHKRADIWRRKIYRILSLLMLEKEGDSSLQ